MFLTFFPFFRRACCFVIAGAFLLLILFLVYRSLNAKAETAAPITSVHIFRNRGDHRTPPRQHRVLADPRKSKERLKSKERGTDRMHKITKADILGLNGTLCQAMGAENDNEMMGWYLTAPTEEMNDYINILESYRADPG